MQPFSVAARGALYLSAMLCVGAFVTVGLFRRIGHERNDDARRAQRIGWIGLCVSLVCVLWAQLTEMQMGYSADMIRSVVFETKWGTSWAIVLAIAMVGAVMAMRAAIPMLAQLILVVLLGVSVGGLGHPAADAHHPFLARLYDAVHVLSASAWVGTLTVVAYCARRLSQDEAGRLWSGFSTLALFSAAATVFAGVGSSWLTLDGIHSLVDSDYGALLFKKIMFVLFVLIAAWWNRRTLKSNPTPSKGALRTEFALLVVVMLLTTLMTGTAPAGE